MKRIVLTCAAVAASIIAGHAQDSPSNPQIVTAPFDNSEAYIQGREHIEWSQTWHAYANKTDKPRVLLIGDSITNQYHEGVDKQLDGIAYVSKLVNSRCAGDPLLLEEVALVLREYNYAVIHFNNGLHGGKYTTEEYTKGLAELYELIRAMQPEAKLIWATTTPVMDKNNDYALSEAWKQRVIDRNNAALNFFADKQVAIDDLNGNVAKNTEYYRGGDGTHLVSLGVKANANRVTDAVKHALGYKTDLENFPQGYSPMEVGNKLANHLLETNDMKDKHGIHYAQNCALLGAMRFAQTTGNSGLLDGLRAHVDGWIAEPEGRLQIMDHVDRNMMGCVPLELYLATGEKKYLDLGLPYADTQWKVPSDAKDNAKDYARKGYSWQTRLWIDDMFMITIVQSQAYRATKNSKYLNRAAKEMVMYLDKLQLENGLFYHAPDVPYIWARGDGWMAAGMSELLKLLPQKNQYRAAIMKGYLKMMNTLKEYQQGDGLWNQLIDEPEFWPETSGSAMFTYAMINGVKNGWLDYDEYASVIRRAWLALVNYITPEGDVREVCVGTGKKNSKQYYYDRGRKVGDYHGQAPYLWCANALLEK